MLGRHTNTSGTAEVFTTLLEAASGAVVGDKVASIPTEDGTLFLLHKRETTPLVDGFLPHKLFILDESAHQMEQHRQLMVPSAMKTDGWMHEDNEDAVHHMVLKNKDVFVDPACSAFANIGRFKVAGEPDKLPRKQFEWLRNELVMQQTVERDVTVLDIPDFFGETKEERERWIEPYMAAMDQQNYVCLLADFPQAGKSFLCKEYAKRRGRKVLFITPNNALGDKLEVEGYPYRTQHKFHGRDFRGKKVRDTDWSEYDMFVFEEVYQVPIFFLNLVSDFKDAAGDDVKIFSNGDPLQNPPIEELNNLGDDRVRFYTRIVQGIFPVDIRLKINKTISQREQADLARLKEELFSGDYKPFEILANWFEETSLAALTKEQIVITLENNTMCHVNNAIMDGNLTPRLGQRWRCRTNCKGQQGEWAVVNLTYYIAKMSGSKPGDFVYLKTKGPTGYVVKELDVTVESLLKNFQPPYAITCHGLQGDSVDNDVVLADAGHPYMTAAHMWTSLTRKRGSLKNIRWLPADSDAKKLLKRAAVSAVSSVRAADRAKDIDVDSLEDYVDEAWFNKTIRRLNYRCPGGCNKSFGYSADNIATIHRMDNAGEGMGAAEIIHAAYTNPETGFRGREALYQVLKGQVTRADIKRYYDSQGATQVFAKAPKVAALPPVTAYSPELLWEADLMDFAKLKTKNKGFAYALVVIDDFTKKVWTVSLKTKTIRDVIAGFRQVFKSAGAKPLRLMTDEEAAITSKTFQDFANKEGVRWNNKNQHAAIVERVVGTFKDNIERFFVSSKTLKWISVLDAFVRAYNKKKHATTGEAPNDVHGGVTTRSRGEQGVSSAIVQDVRMRMKEKRVAILSKLVNSKLKCRSGQTRQSDR
ncbi:hypothetical protein WJX72_001189 [[Myrmecia] bisecta]|uniref:Integrase catalytic domain-containing protein n=1 Tax=[Myrmecia] bisecta TaxID=41462 RepID=A0AAW1Q735_9CHLO